MSKWEKIAAMVEEIYGVFVDWDERFFICPECGEPIYESDWDDELLLDDCPVCGFEWEEEE